MPTIANVIWCGGYLRGSAKPHPASAPPPPTRNACNIICSLDVGGTLLWNAMASMEKQIDTSVIPQKMRLSEYRGMIVICCGLSDGNGVMELFLIVVMSSMVARRA